MPGGSGCPVKLRNALIPLVPLTHPEQRRTKRYDRHSEMKGRARQSGEMEGLGGRGEDESK